MTGIDFTKAPSWVYPWLERQFLVFSIGEYGVSYEELGWTEDSKGEYNPDGRDLSDLELFGQTAQAIADEKGLGIVWALDGNSLSDVMNAAVDARKRWLNHCDFGEAAPEVSERVGELLQEEYERSDAARIREGKTREEWRVMDFR